MSTTTEETPVETVAADTADEVAVPEAAAVPAQTEAPAEKAETPVDLTAFTEALDAAIAGHDESTGVVPDELAAPVQAAYRALDGLKAKNAARKLVNDRLRDSMNEGNIFKAKAHMTLADSLTAGPSGGGSRAERTPADPTEAFVQRLAGLYLAAELATANKPEGVGEYTEKLDELLEQSRDGAKQYAEWLNREPVAEGAEDVPEPEVSAFVKGAVKLSQGRSARVGGSTSSGSRSSAPYTGERRDIGKHIQEAFEGQPSGTFLTVAEIRKFDSSQYTSENPASAGAISSRLFPTTGNCTIEGIIPDTNEKGNRGARKA